ncbi:hypothetical protein AAHC03_01700 [Spirometra sp. Aus1]
MPSPPTSTIAKFLVSTTNPATEVTAPSGPITDPSDYDRTYTTEDPNMDREVKDAIRSQLEVSTGIVTYKSLCVSLGWNSEQSKRNLGLYSQLDKKMNQTFCLSGLSRKNGGPMEWVVSLAPSIKALPSSVAFLHTPNKFIYSMHKTNKLSTTALANFDSALSADLATHRQEHNVPKTTLLPKPEVVAQKSPQKSSPKTVKHIPTKRPSHSKASARSQVKKKSQSSLAFKPSVPAAPSEQAEQPDPFADSDEQSSDEDITLSTSSNPKKRQRLYFSSEDEDEKPEEVKADTKRSSTKDTEEASSDKLPVHSPKSPGTMTRRAPAKQPSPAVEKVLHSVLKKSPTRKHDSAPATHAVQRQRVLKTFKDDDGFLITEKVWEGCDVEEPSEPSASKPAESSTTIEKVPAKPKASSTSAKTSAKGPSGMPKQATLMSFFNR